MDSIDEAIQKLPLDVQDIILDYVLDDIKFIDIQIKKGWIRKLKVHKDLEADLTKVIQKRRRFVDMRGTTNRIPLSKPNNSGYLFIEFLEAWQKWYVMENDGWWWSDDHVNWTQWQQS